MTRAPSPAEAAAFLRRCQALNAQGLSGTQIAALVGKSRTRVNEVLLAARTPRPDRRLDSTKPCACGSAACVAVRKDGEPSYAWTRRKYASRDCQTLGKKMRRILPPTKPCACGDASCVATRRKNETASDWGRRKYAGSECRSGPSRPSPQAVPNYASMNLPWMLREPIANTGRWA